MNTTLAQISARAARTSAYDRNFSNGGTYAVICALLAALVFFGFVYLSVETRMVTDSSDMVQYFAIRFSQIAMFFSQIAA